MVCVCVLKSGRCNKCREAHAEGNRINTMYGYSSTTQNDGVLVCQCGTAEFEHHVTENKSITILHGESCSFKSRQESIISGA